MLTRKFNVLLPAMVLFTCSIGCGSSLRVTSIQLGRSVNADSTVASHTTTFAPGDTVHLAVLTSGVGSGTISVRWTYAGRVVDEPKKQVSYRDVAVTEFQLQSPGQLPLGEYSAEVFFDGQSVGTRPFRVEEKH
jgi:hypothetical protein